MTYEEKLDLVLRALPKTYSGVTLQEVMKYNDQKFTVLSPEEVSNIMAVITKEGFINTEPVIFNNNQFSGVLPVRNHLGDAFFERTGGYAAIKKREDDLHKAALKSTEEPPFNLGEFIKEIKEYFPLITAVILIGGIIRLIIFFKYFKVDITQYIGLDEIIILSLNDLLYYFAITILLLPCVIVYVYAPHYLKLAKNQIIPRHNLKYFLLLASFSGLAISILFLYNPNDVFRVAAVTSLAIGIGGFLIGRLTKYHIPVPYFIVSFFVICFIATSCITPYMKAKRFTASTGEHTSTVILNDRTIEGFKKLYLFSLTKNYLFFFNDSTGNPEIEPISNLQSLKLGNLPYLSGSGSLSGENILPIEKTKTKTSRRYKIKQRYVDSGYVNEAYLMADDSSILMTEDGVPILVETGKPDTLKHK